MDPLEVGSCHLDTMIATSVLIASTFGKPKDILIVIMV